MLHVFFLQSWVLPHWSSETSRKKSIFINFPDVKATWNKNRFFTKQKCKRPLTMSQWQRTGARKKSAEASPQISPNIYIYIYTVHIYEPEWNELRIFSIKSSLLDKLEFAENLEMFETSWRSWSKTNVKHLGFQSSIALSSCLGVPVTSPGILWVTRPYRSSKNADLVIFISYHIII